MFFSPVPVLDIIFGESVIIFYYYRCVLVLICLLFVSEILIGLWNVSRFGKWRTDTWNSILLAITAPLISSILFLLRLINFSSKRSMYSTHIGIGWLFVCYYDHCQLPNDSCFEDDNFPTLSVSQLYSSPDEICAIYVHWSSSLIMTNAPFVPRNILLFFALGWNCQDNCWLNDEPPLNILLKFIPCAIFYPLMSSSKWWSAIEHAFKC